MRPPEDDPGRGQPAAGLLGALSWGFRRAGGDAGQRRVHAADTIEPGPKTGIRCSATVRPTAQLTALSCVPPQPPAQGPGPAPRRLSARGPATAGRLVGGPGEDAARHGRGGPRRPGREDLLARPLHTFVVGLGQPGVLDEVAGQAEGPVGRTASDSGASVASARSCRARSAKALAPPASAASSIDRARSGAGFKVAGLPSHHPPYWRHTVWTMNSGSS